MAVRNRKNPSKTGINNNGRNYLSFSKDKKKSIVGIFLILFSIFLFLSILSYDRRDEANLGNSIFSGTGEIHNWLGTVGAHFSQFFIRSVIGYFSLIFTAVILFGVWLFERLPRVLITQPIF
jgi:hypothetical protein